MEKEYDVTALGEVLIDMTAAGKSADGKNLYEENPGGAPANCAAAVAKLGGKAAFIGMTGFDSFGNDIRATLEGVGLDTRGMRRTEEQHTTLAFVSLDAGGERHFSFCRNPGADTRLRPEDLDVELLKNSCFLQVGSLSLTNQPSKSAELEAVRIVKEAGGFISYDPNYREKLWGGRADAVDEMKSVMPFADVIKISDEELKMIFPGASPEKSAKILHDGGTRIVLITLGSKGVFYSVCSGSNSGNQEFSGYEGVPPVRVVDTTGAGDSFTGGFLYSITRERKKNLFVFSRLEFLEHVRFANATASLCVTKRGAIPALPTLNEVEEFIRRNYPEEIKK